MAGRGWAWTAYDWDEGRLFNYIGDAQNTFPVWNATPLVALDVYEHAYFLDYRHRPRRRTSTRSSTTSTGRRRTTGSIKYADPDSLADGDVTRRARSSVAGYLLGSMPVGLLARAGSSSTRTSARSAAATSARRTSGATYGRSYGVPVDLLDVRRASCPRSSACSSSGDLVGVLAGGAAMLGHWRPLFLGFRRGGKMVATAAASSRRSRRSVALAAARWSGCVVFVVVPLRVASPRSSPRVALPLLALAARRAVAGDRCSGRRRGGVLVLHRANIRRLRPGTESRFHFGRTARAVGCSSARRAGRARPSRRRAPCTAVRPARPRAAATCRARSIGRTRPDPRRPGECPARRASDQSVPAIARALADDAGDQTRRGRQARGPRSAPRRSGGRRRTCGRQATDAGRLPQLSARAAPPARARRRPVDATRRAGPSC